MISHFIRNTGSYFRMTKSNSSDEIKKETKMKQSSSLTNFKTVAETAKNVITLTDTIASKANDSKNVSGLASLSCRNVNNNGILMKTGQIRSKTSGKNVVKNILSSDQATRLEGFNALMSSDSKKIVDTNQNIYIGKIHCIKTFRKGGYF